MSWKDDVQENIKCGLVEILILGLLTTEDMYGYQLQREIAKRGDPVLLPKNGSLYGVLHRMEAKGLITTKKVLAGEKRYRNYFHIEPNGMEYLEYGIQEFRSIFELSNDLLKSCDL